MAQTYDNLPVFKSVYDLLLVTIQITQKMTRDYRFTLAEDLKKRLFHIQVQIYHANKEHDQLRKLEYIDAALDDLVEVKLYYRILYDCKQIPLKRFACIAEDTVRIERHLEAWRKYYLPSAGPKSS